MSEFVSQHYQKYDNFGNLPWFIGEYGANGQTEDTIISDLTLHGRSSQPGKWHL